MNIGRASRLSGQDKRTAGFLLTPSDVGGHGTQ